MLTNILNVEGVRELNKKEQLKIVGAVDTSECQACGGFPGPEGQCFGDAAVCFCLYGVNGPCDF